MYVCEVHSPAESEMRRRWWRLCSNARARLDDELGMFDASCTRLVLCDCLVISGIFERGGWRLGWGIVKARNGWRKLTRRILGRRMKAPIYRCCESSWVRS